MRKPTRKLWARQCRLALYRAAARRRTKLRTRGHPSTFFVAPRPTLRAPRRFDVIRGSGPEVVKFLRAMAVRVLEQGQPVRLDFRFTESFHPAGTILLFAEVDRIVSLSQLAKPITIVDPRLRRPREVLKQIGIFELTQDKCDIVPEREDVVYWRATKGLNQSGQKLSVLEVVANRVNRDHAHQVELSGLWRGVSEAVANAVEHAYTRPRSDGFTGLADTRWWMFTHLRDNTFTVAVCDLGCGYRATINATLPEQFIATVASTLNIANRDALAIDTAMEYGRSGTRQTERGRGSRDAISVLEKHGAGDLIIVSNTGCFRYGFDAGKQVVREQIGLGTDIKGTIVWWKLPLKGP